MINLSNFVDVNINYKIASSITSTRDTAVLIKNHTSAPSDTIKDLYEVKTIKVGSANISVCIATYTDFPSVVDYKPTSDVNFIADKSYFKDEDGTLATPVNKDLYEEVNDNEYEKSLDIKFNSSKTYYTKSGTAYTEATPTNLTLKEIDTDKTDINYATPEDKLYYYYSMFFQNGGQKLMVISIQGDSSVLSKDNFEAIVNTLDYQYIVITSIANYTVMNELAKALNDEKVNGYMHKKVITHITPTEYENITVTSPTKNFAIKYGLPGIEMTMAAYLTQIDIDNYASVKDYAFTIEKVSYQYEVAENAYTTVGEAYTDNALVTKLMKENINVDGELVNNIRALGGNDFAGDEFVNYYMLIVLHQTLTERLVGVLTQKLKYNPSSLSLVGSALGAELDRYVNCGYISTNDAWTDDSLYYKGNLIIAKNSLLPLGYKYVVMPFSTLTEQDRKEHKLPKIFVLISDGYTVRKIEIVGEVF